ncbi:MAG: sulfatase-like hydrolase/transferase [Thermoguttaceae bacterium]
MRQSFIPSFSLFLIVVLSGFLTAKDSGPNQNSTSPNIIILFADDLAFNAIAAAGNDIVKTPNLDRLAKQGVTFSNAYNQGGWHGAICVASRSMLNTGRFIWNAQQLLKKNADKKNSEPNETINNEFWSKRLQEKGYQTGICGKWHVEFPVSDVFQSTKNIRGGMPPTVPSSYNRPQQTDTNLINSDADIYSDDVWNPFDHRFVGHWSGGTHWAEVLANDAIEMFQEKTKDGKPFFGYFAFNSPHDPRQSPKEFVDMYPTDKMDVPPNFLPQHPEMEAMGCPATLRDEQLAPYPRTSLAVQVHRREYYAIISHMDMQVGRILDAIEATGQQKNTIIIFTADNGLAIGSHGLFGKQSLYEHSVKVPLIISGPNIPKNKVIDTPVYFQDIMPTSLELAGADVPDSVQFKSLMPLIRDETTKHYNAIYGAYIGHQRMIRKDNWKLILLPDAKKYYLFDLQSDPNELNDLSSDVNKKLLIKTLFAELQILQKETGDKLDLSQFFPELSTTQLVIQ